MLIMTITIYLFLLEIHSTPWLGDLFTHITPRYAADWKVIGTLLDLPKGELRNIEASNPTNSRWCCNKMLEGWLKNDPSATWIKMFAAIESPAISGASKDGKAFRVPKLCDICKHCICLTVYI